MSGHSELPWFVSGVRFRMNGGEWHSINRYDESKKQDMNIACVGYDPRTGDGLSDAHFIVSAVNAYPLVGQLVEALQSALDVIVSQVGQSDSDPSSEALDALDVIEDALAAAAAAKVAGSAP